jgi:hypothetical protein
LCPLPIARVILNEKNGNNDPRNLSPESMMWALPSQTYEMQYQAPLARYETE